jgi:steroid delta-isomerase-like uncharacterized protein
MYIRIAAVVVASTALAFASLAIGASPEENGRIARRVYEHALSQGRFDVPYTPDFVGHGGNGTFTHEAGLAEARGWRSAFPDLAVEVDLVVAERDLVAVRWTARGTNTGTGNGIPATGKRVETTGTTIFRFEDGAIAEEWTAGNSLGLMRQLGLLPAPRSASAAASGATKP